MKKASVRSSVFMHYIMAYFGAVLLSCASVGLLLFFASTHQLQEAYEVAAYQKMEQAISDFQAQLDELNSIAAKISLSKLCSPSYIKQGKYYETQLLEELRIYSGTSPYSANFFLIYFDQTGITYHSTGTTNYFTYYCRYSLHVPEYEVLYEQLRSLTGRTVIADAQQSYVLIAAPVRFLSDANRIASGQAALCFVVEKSAIMLRTQTVTGGMDSPFSLYYQGIDLTGGAVDASDPGLLQLASYDHSITIAVDNSQNQLFPSLTAFKVINLIAIGVIILLLLFFALWLAYKSYRPIRRLAEKYGAPDRTETDELKKIDQAMGRAYGQIGLQMKLLKRQALNLLVHAGNADEALERLTLLGVSLTGPVYFALSARLMIEGIIEPTEKEKLLEMIEALSDENMSFFPIKINKQNRLALVLSCRDSSQKEEAEELLGNFLASQEYAFVIASGDVCMSPDQLYISYSLASMLCTQREKEQNSPDRTFRKSYAALDDTVEHIQRIVAAIESGKKEEGQEACKRLFRFMRDNAGSAWMVRYIASDVAIHIFRKAKSLGIPIHETQLQAALSARTVDQLESALPSLTVYCCETAAKQKDAIQQDRTKEILNYIKQHCLDYDLTLSTLADHFSMRPSTFSQLFKQAVGKTYKDYIISMRMSAAKQMLLSEGLTVSEICERVGYRNISYFIKAFRELEGVTPLGYRDQFLTKKQIVNQGGKDE